MRDVLGLTLSQALWRCSGFILNQSCFRCCMKEKETLRTQSRLPACCYRS